MWVGEEKTLQNILKQSTKPGQKLNVYLERQPLGLKRSGQGADVYLNPAQGLVLPHIFI